MIQNAGAGGTMVTGASIKTYQLLALASAVDLEAKGLRVRRGVNATKMAQQQTGLRTRDRAKLAARLREMAQEHESRLRYFHEKAERYGTQVATDILCEPRDTALLARGMLATGSNIVAKRDGNPHDGVHPDIERLLLDGAPEAERPDILSTFVMAFQRRLTHYLEGR
jgi:hypothetical protein